MTSDYLAAKSAAETDTLATNSLKTKKLFSPKYFVSIFMLFDINLHFLHSRVVSGEFAAALEPLPSVGNSILPVRHILCIFGQWAFTAVFGIGSSVHGLWKLSYGKLSLKS